MPYGFGDTDPVPGGDNVSRPTILQEVTMTHVTNNDCSIFSIPITNAMLCAGDGTLNFYINNYLLVYSLVKNYIFIFNL